MYCSAERLNLRVIMHTSRHVLILGHEKIENAFALT